VTRAKLIAVLAVASVTVPIAVASTGPTVPWTRADILAAVRALGYPSGLPRRLACTGMGAADTSGRYASFRCKATYGHHRSRRFQIAGQGEGGWLCAGKTIAGCKLLRRGFVSRATVGSEGFDAAANSAARGWMTNKYGTYQVTHYCTASTSTSSSSYTCDFHVSSAKITVALTFIVAKRGYLLTASAS
jgi:hypothetical protein